ncbi:hypothetical protein C1646_813479 [Rhizophagus diaphanus]|nr:hypothetical protein C1646_813479 [Rhizophagus diaphanus] [Rhizophagus sp. MUCL 43196]
MVPLLHNLLGIYNESSIVIGQFYEKDPLIICYALISSATTIINEVISIYQQAEYNKKIISALYGRTKLAEHAVDTLQRRKNFMKDIRNFAKEISTIRDYQKYFKSYSIKDKFEELSVKYDTVMKDLNFTLAFSNEEHRRYDNECLMDDVSEMRIVEWAQYGTLRETYEVYDIPWTRKLHIATDICRAITFLHSAEIYHHDLRCENVMLTDHLEPKFANFEYTRRATPIVNITRIFHLLAPEK